MTTIVTYTLAKCDNSSSLIFSIYNWLTLLIVALKYFYSYLQQQISRSTTKKSTANNQLQNLHKLKTHNIKIHRTKYLRYRIKNVMFLFLSFIQLFRVAKMMHYCMYCNTQASESFFFSPTLEELYGFVIQYGAKRLYPPRYILACNEERTRPTSSAWLLVLASVKGAKAF